MTWNLVAFLAGLEAALLIAGDQAPDGFSYKLLWIGLAAAIATVVVKVGEYGEKKNKWRR